MVGASPVLKPGPKPANPKIARITSARATSARTTSARTTSARPKPKLGLRAWMERVLVECDLAQAGFDADPVHDLRVALRRRRSTAAGLMGLDPESSWKEMKQTQQE